MTAPARKPLWVMEQKLHKMIRQIEDLQKDIESRPRKSRDNDLEEVVMILDSAKAKLHVCAAKLEEVREWNRQLKEQLR